jgi:hypothetical protein
VLQTLRPQLAILGFEVESGKNREDKSRPHFRPSLPGALNSIAGGNNQAIVPTGQAAYSAQPR